MAQGRHRLFTSRDRGLWPAYVSSGSKICQGLNGMTSMPAELPLQPPLFVEGTERLPSRKWRVVVTPDGRAGQAGNGFTRRLRVRVRAVFFLCLLVVLLLCGCF